jgi:hypothetical protein
MIFEDQETMDYGLHKKQLCDSLKIGGQTFEKVTYDETLLLVATWEHSLHNPIDTVCCNWLVYRRSGDTSVDSKCAEDETHFV